jgi:hypothetical protein
MVSNLNLRPDPPPGQAIADVTRGGLVEWYYEILAEDGHPIGAIRVSGTNAGSPQPGQTKQINFASYVVVGGNGAFLGVRGYMGSTTGFLVSPRLTSMTEDPANRSVLGGGGVRQGLYLLPMFSPEVIAGTGGPAVFHGDFTRVIASSPAQAGETIIVRMTGLGPTIPGVEPGEPFPGDPLQPVNSPVDALVNGVAAEIVNSLGWPGTVGEYRVDIRIPAETTGGAARIQVSAAWIQGPEFSIPMR